MADGGNPFELSRGEADRLRDELRSVWCAMFGDEPGRLSADLERLSMLYGPTATPGRVREVLRGMPAVQVRQRTLTAFDPPLALGGEAGLLLTPEGRVALQQLADAPPQAAETVLAPQAGGVLVDQYREWAQAHVRAVLRVREGRGTATRPAALGLVVLMFLLGARDSNTALVINRDMPIEADIALREILAAFAKEVSSRPGKPGVPIWQWPISRAEARFDAVRRDQSGGLVERYWIDDSARERTLKELAGELLRRPRVASPACALEAMRTVAEAYDEREELLRSAGVRPSTGTDRAALYEEFRSALSALTP